MSRCLVAFTAPQFRSSAYFISRFFVEQLLFPCSSVFFLAKHAYTYISGSVTSRVFRNGFPRRRNQVKYAELAPPTVSAVADNYFNALKITAVNPPPPPPSFTRSFLGNFLRRVSGSSAAS